MDLVNEPILRLYNLYSKFLGLGVAFLGAVSYAGVAFNIPFLNHPDAMNNLAPSTALLFVILGLTTAFFSHFAVYDRTEQQVLMCLSSSVTVIAAMILGKFMFDYALDVDTLVWGEQLPPIEIPCPFRMTHLTALCFVFLGIAFNFLTSENDRKIKIGQILIILPLLFSTWSCFGYLFGSADAINPGIAQMALRSAFLILVLSISMLLSRPDRGYLWVLSSETAGGMMIRQFIPMALVGPLALGIICWSGEKAGYYDSNASLALISTSASAFFLCVLFASFGFARQLDQMTQQLLDRVEKLNIEHKDRIVKLNHVNDELKNLSEEALRAQDQALAISRLKSEFVSKMSQEIRIPMNGVLSIVEALLRMNLSETIREYVMVMRDAGRAFLVIINDILDFSSIEEGSLVIENGPVDIVQLVDGAGKLLAAQASKKGLLFLTFVDPNVPDTIVGDEVRLRQILLNLGGNAIKFTESGKVLIKANLSSEDGREVDIRFSVEDTGIGISDEEKRRLFQPFSQADGTISRKYGGTGLGLSISKKLVELMGGDIGADSIKGKGSTFWFRCAFPASRKRSLREAVLFDRTSAILLVEDYDSREVLERYLEYFACKVHLAKSPVELLDKAKQVIASGDEFATTIVFVDHSYYSPTKDSDASLIFDSDTKQELEMLQRGQELYTVVLTGYEGIQPGDTGKYGDVVLRRPFSRSQIFSCLEKASGLSRDDTTLGMTPAPGEGRRMATTMHRVPAATKPGETSALDSSLGLALVVDDSSINRHVAVVLLEGLGMKCHTASNGLQAIREYNANKYDIIIMDCQMPEMDGYSATKQIRRLEKRTGQHVPIVALTANVVEGSREACLAAGMDDFMSKPVNADILEQALRKWVPALSTGMPIPEEEEA